MRAHEGEMAKGIGRSFQGLQIRHGDLPRVEETVSEGPLARHWWHDAWTRRRDMLSPIAPPTDMMGRGNKDLSPNMSRETTCALSG